MICVAVIHQNMASFDEMSYDDICGNKLRDFISKYVTVIQMDASSNDATLKSIIDIVGTTNDATRKTHKCFETRTNTVYSIYVPSDTDSNNSNNLGRFVSECHECVSGDCILLNTRDMNNCDITMDSVTDIFRSKFVHTAIKITPDGTFTNVCYHKNPIESTSIIESNCRCVQIDFLGKTLCVFLEIVPTDVHINRYATILCKKLRIHGDVIVSMISTFPSIEITNIDEKMVRDIIIIRSNNGENMTIPDDPHENFYNTIRTNLRRNDIINENIPDDVMDGLSMNESLMQ